MTRHLKDRKRHPLVDALENYLDLQAYPDHLRRIILQPGHESDALLHLHDEDGIGDLRGKGDAAFRGQRRKRRDEQGEVERLKAELKKVTEERDILKKAAAYFAKELK